MVPPGGSVAGRPSEARDPRQTDPRRSDVAGNPRLSAVARGLAAELREEADEFEEDPLEELPTFELWLEKKSAQWLVGWQKRFFILQDGLLSWYGDDKIHDPDVARAQFKG